MGILQTIKHWLFSSHPEKITHKSQAQSADHDPTTERLRQSEERFRVLVESIQDYAIYILDPNGFVVSWNTGAERIKGYQANEIVGKHFSRFCPTFSLNADDLKLALRLKCQPTSDT